MPPDATFSFLTRCLPPPSRPFGTTFRAAAARPRRNPAAIALQPKLWPNGREDPPDLPQRENVASKELPNCASPPRRRGGRRQPPLRVGMKFCFFVSNRRRPLTAALRACVSPMGREDPFDAAIRARRAAPSASGIPSPRGRGGGRQPPVRGNEASLPDRRILGAGDRVKLAAVPTTTLVIPPVFDYLGFRTMGRLSFEKERIN